MSNRFKFADLNYYYHRGITDPAAVTALHRPANLYAPALAADADVLLLKHMDFTGGITQYGVDYHFFPGSQRFFQRPRQSHQLLRYEKPDMVLVQGLIFPVQLMLLRRALGPRCVIVAQHQGEVPFRRKKIFQQLADRVTDGYLFSARPLADEWISAGVIRNAEKCFEINPSSTLLAREPRQKARESLGMKDGPVFLWVGRLNENKDPLTVLSGLSAYLARENGHLYMIYNDDGMEGVVQDKIQQDPVLRQRVCLVGKVPHGELAKWYSAADFFISGSHLEGGSFALTEAMACGCVPVVTGIPAAVKATGAKWPLRYRAGDAAGLAELLSGLKQLDIPELSAACEKRYREEASPEAVAANLKAVYECLRAR